MKIELDFQKRHFYLVAFLFSFVFGVVMAGAFDPTDPNSVGHPIGELIDENGNLNIPGTITAANVDVNNKITAAEYEIAGLRTGQWILSGSDIYYDVGNVAIGKDTVPLAELDVEGNVLVSGDVGIGIASPGGKLHVSGGDIVLDAGNKLVINQGAGGNNFLQSPSVASPRLGIFTESLERISINYGDGHVGIGKTNPGVKLDVAGDTYISGKLGIAKIDPAETLEVGGNAVVTGNLDVTGDLPVSGKVDAGGSGVGFPIRCNWNAWLCNTAGPAGRCWDTGTWERGTTLDAYCENGYIKGFRQLPFNTP